MTESDASPADDGRRQRRERNRDAVVDALLGLFRDGELAPSADDIARRAGLSPRSLFRYFEDIDDLCRAAIARQHSRVFPILERAVDVALPLPQRITAFVEHRLEVFDAMGTVGVVSRLRAPFHPLVAAELARGRNALRRQLTTTFAVELGALPASSRSAAVTAIDTLASFEAYQLMHTEQSLSRSRIASVLSETISRLLDPEVRSR